MLMVIASKVGTERLRRRDRRKTYWSCIALLSIRLHFYHGHYLKKKKN